MFVTLVYLPAVPATPRVSSHKDLKPLTEEALDPEAGPGDTHWGFHKGGARFWESLDHGTFESNIS